jgi:hypothetical protein
MQGNEKEQVDGFQLCKRVHKLLKTKEADFRPKAKSSEEYQNNGVEHDHRAINAMEPLPHLGPSANHEQKEKARAMAGGRRNLQTHYSTDVKREPQTPTAMPLQSRR